jgi:hypothetical protein
MDAAAMSESDKKVRPLAAAYNRGYLAGRRGCTGKDNPYQDDSREARAWIVGLLDGRSRQLTVVRTE